MIASRPKKCLKILRNPFLHQSLVDSLTVNQKQYLSLQLYAFCGRQKTCQLCIGGKKRVKHSQFSTTDAFSLSDIHTHPNPAVYLP